MADRSQLGPRWTIEILQSDPHLAFGYRRPEPWVHIPVLVDEMTGEAWDLPASIDPFMINATYHNLIADRHGTLTREHYLGLMAMELNDASIPVPARHWPHGPET